MEDAMAEPVDLEVLSIIIVVASVIVFAGWSVVAAMAALLIRRQVAGIRARAGGVLPPPEGMAIAFYALGVLFWPASFIAGVYFMTKPETTLQGRNCLYIGLMYLSVITGLTCAGMAALGVWSPELLAPLFG